MKALVAHALNDIRVEDVRLDPPQTGEVRVKMSAVGVCHSDLSAVNGTIPHPFPFVLGHEGAGVVTEVGPGVTRTAPGDHVVMSFVPNCGRCYHCVRGEAYLCLASQHGGKRKDGSTRHHLGDKPIGSFLQLGNMAEEVVCPEINIVPIAKDISLRAASLIGCGVTTGVGAVLHTARVEPGSTVAVFGCGGVGLAAVQGARIAGASRIFAVDLSEDKLELAKRFGATDLVKAGPEAHKQIQKQTGGLGVDYAFEVIGIGAVVQQALDATRRGGMAVAVGVGKLTDEIKLNALIFPLANKVLSGCMFGGANPAVDFPMLLELYRAHKLDLEGMVTKTYSIDEAPQAFADLERGANARGVVVFD